MHIRDMWDDVEEIQIKRLQIIFRPCYHNPSQLSINGKAVSVLLSSSTHAPLPRGMT